MKRNRKNGKIKIKKNKKGDKMVKKGKEKRTINYVSEEEYKTSKLEITNEELSVIFNKKFYNYIKKKENSLLEGCNYV